MSELIDRIYDVEKISKEVADVVAGIEKSIAAIDGFKKSVDELEKSTRKSKGTEDLINNTKLLNDNVVKGGIEMKRYEAEVQKLKEKTEQLTNSEKAASIEIAKARIELQAAQKATKDLAIEQIELEAKTKGATGSYNELQKELKFAIKAFRDLSAAEQSEAKGKELINKIKETQTTLKAIDESMGNYSRNVGNYEESIKQAATSINGMKEQLKDLNDKLNNMDVNSDEFKETKTVIDNLSLAVDQAAGKVDEFGNKEPKNIAKKIFEDTMVTVGILSSSINALSGAFGDNEGAQEALTKATQGLAISQSVANVVKEKGAIVDTIVLAKEKALAISKVVLTGLTRIFGLTSVQAWAAATLGISLLITGIIVLIANFNEIINATKSFFGITNEFAETEAKVKSLTKAMEGFNESTQLATERMKAEGKSDQEILNFKKKRYTEELAMNRSRYIELKKLTRSLTDEEKTQLEESAKFVKNSASEKYKLHSEQIALTRSLNQKASEENKKQNEEARKLEDKALAAKRRLTDSSIALMEESREKQLKINTETYTRQIEDLRRNGDLTTELKNNLLQAQRNNEDKINKEWDVKKLNDTIKADELTLENMKKSGQSTLEFEKQILQDRMKAEILAGGNVLEIKQKYKFLELDLEAKTADEKVALFEKQLSKESELLTNSYSEKELQLKREFSQSKQTADDKLKYENKLAKLKLDALLEVNDKTIESLEKELKVSGLSDDKKAELSNKLKKLKIDNENAVTDAVIKNNEEQVKSDDDAKKKRIEVATALAEAGAEIFGAIAEYEKQRSEEKIKEYEAELDANDLKFEKEQSNLDNAIMSDEMRAEKQNEINEKKFAADQVIQDKIKAEKVKQAKWEKANSIIQAIIGTGLAIISGLKNPFPLNLIAVGLATTLGAIQVATIASQPIPAFEKGGVTGDGLALWGETRPEVAVLPSGDVMLAEKPTITDFDAGTRIYKSIADYELAMGGKNGGSFEFDYDKMGEKMKAPTINLDSRGLWGIVSKQNARTTLINRRYRLN